jgi:DNA-binding transcriptional MocR family regulator
MAARDASGLFGGWIDVPLESALRGWSTGTGPVFDQLAAALRHAIERGQLPPGSRLPPERLLGSYLGVGRRTVARAYRSLEALGLVERRQGRGTTVRGLEAPRWDDRMAKLTTALQRNIVFRSLAHEPAPTVDLLSVYSPPSGGLVAELMQSAASLLGGELTVHHHGYMPAGYPPLRAAIAQRYTDTGIPTVEEEVLVTSGAQQGISLVASAFVKPGQLVVVEDPTVPGAIDAFRAFGARLLTVPVHEDGVHVNAVAAVLARNTASVVYVMPTYQSPTGAVMPERSRKLLVELAARTSVPVVEDTTLTDLGMGCTPPPPLAAYSRTAPVLSIGSLSKLFWAGLRVGWIRGPRALIAHLARLKAVTDLGTSVLSQAVAVHLLGEVEQMKCRRGAEMSEKLKLMESLLATRCPGWTWRTPPGGLCVWCKLPMGSALEFTQFALKHGVAITPGTVASATNSFDDHIRLPFWPDPLGSVRPL